MLVFFLDGFYFLVKLRVERGNVKMRGEKKGERRKYIFGRMGGVFVIRGIWFDSRIVLMRVY